MKLPAVPVNDLTDVTLNFEALQRTQIDASSLPILGKRYGLPTGGDNTGALAAAISDANARGGDVIELRGGIHNVSAVNLAGKSNIKLKGAGRNATILRFTTTTGNVFDLTNASFCEAEDMTIVANAQKTAGALFFLDKGAGVCQQNMFRRLVIGSGYRAFQLGDVSLTTIEDILVQDVNASWGWDSFVYASGQAVSTTVDRLKGGTAAGCVNGVCRLNSSNNDTFHARDWDLASQSGSSMAGIIVDGGEWVTFTDCSIESGTTGVAVTINGGKRCHLNHGHLLGQSAIAVGGGRGFKAVGTEIVESTVHAIQLSGGTDTELIGVEVSDVGFIGGGGSGWNAVEVTAGVTDFTVAHCQLGRADLGATTILWGVHVNAGASDRYIIQGNRTTNFTGGGTTGVSDGGTGTHKDVSGNVGA